MLARRSGGILNVASTIAFQPAPYQAVYGASKAFVLSFSQALWAEARGSGVAVTALCPGPTRTGFVDALGADVGHTTHLQPARRTRARDRCRSPGARQGPGRGHPRRAKQSSVPPAGGSCLASGSLCFPHGCSARSRASRPPIVVHNEIVIPASAERVWDLLTDVERWPSWYRACRWVRVESRDSAGRAASFRWKAHPVTLDSRVVAADRPHSFAIVADARNLHADRTFTIRTTADGLSSVVVSHETQVGLLPRLGRLIIAPRLRAANQVMFEDLARAAVEPALTTPPCASPTDRPEPLRADERERIRVDLTRSRGGDG